MAIGLIAGATGEMRGHPPENAIARADVEVTAALIKAGKAVVQVVDNRETGGFRATGVIVSADGYVLSRGLTSRSKPVKVRFGNGQTASAKPLGRSLEWKIGIWKIIDEGAWPYVELGSTAGAHVGQPVALIDYRLDDKAKQEWQRIVRYAAIEYVDPEKWFVTTGVGGTFEFPPLFSLDGRLLGFTNTAYGDDTRKIGTAAEVVTETWRDLVAGKNLDWVRFPPRESSTWRGGIEVIEEPASSDEVESLPDLADAKKIAFDTTVRLISKSRPNFNGSGNESWSGVLVSADGHILTCGHAEPLPGEQLTVQLSDGRDFNGVVIGSNWVSDVALAKVTDSGTWPFAEMVDSSVVEIGDPIVTCGYPAFTLEGKVSADRKPVVCAVRVRLQRPYRLWSRELPISFDGIRRGGMSGGGVFDHEGRYIGVFQGSDATRSEVARLQWDHLTGKKSLKMPTKVDLNPNTDKP